MDQLAPLPAKVLTWQFCSVLPVSCRTLQNRSVIATLGTANLLDLDPTRTMVDNYLSLGYYLISSGTVYVGSERSNTS